MDSTYVVGIDVGGQTSKIGVVDARGTVLAQTVIRTDTYGEIEPFIAELSEAVKKLIRESGTEGKVRGIGVGAPNGNYYTGTIENAPNLRWGHHRVEFSKLLSEAMDGLPVALTNDANAAAVGEMTYGAARGMKNFIMITLGTGVGSGIVINGEVVYGHDGFAGELGHIIVEPGGRNCGCGNNGCLETYASATGIRRTALNLIDNTGTPSVLRKIDRDKLTAKDVSIAAANGDRLALEVWDITGHYLALGISTAVVVTCPEAVFLFGGPTKAGDLLMNPLKKYLDKYMLPAMKDTKVMFSRLGEDAAILGASALALNAIAALNHK